jgi:hypothetical protein
VIYSWLFILILGWGNRTFTCVWDLSFVAYLYISIIYLMDFLYLQRGLESRPCREILYIRCTHIMRVLFCVLYVNALKKPPPPSPALHATDNSTFTFYFKYVFKDTLYFLLKYVLPPVLLTLTQVVLLLITSTFTRVQIQSNSGTTVKFYYISKTSKFPLPSGLFSSGKTSISA